MDGNGAAFSSTNAGAGWGMRYGGGGALTDVSCASASLCAAVARTGDVITFNPASTVPPLRITTGSLPAGVAGVAYEAEVQASGGEPPPYQWSAIGLPPGLSIDPASGRISGTPITAVCVSSPCPQPPATYTPTVTVTDSDGVQSSAPFTIALAGTILGLKVVTAGAGSGEVNSSPAGISECGVPTGSCEASYEHGTVVTLTAKAAAGSTFSGWSRGGCAGTGACQVTIDDDTTLIASFDRTPVVPPDSPAPARLRIGHVRTWSDRSRCARRAGARRQACARVRIVVDGTIAKAARGTVGVEAGIRLDGRHAVRTERARIVGGRWRTRLALPGIGRNRDVTIHLVVRFGGSHGVQPGHAGRRIRFGS